MKFLLATHDAVARVILESTLMADRHDVVACRSAARALELAASAEPAQVLVLDSGLPGESVREACGAARALARSPYVLVIAPLQPLSHAEAFALREAGAEDLLARPLEVGAVRERLALAVRVATARAGLAMRASRAGQQEAPASLDLVGHTVDAKYDVEALIGAGGMGTVYRARHRLVDAPVALKVIHDELAGRPGFRERFVREAKALMRLTHPNVIAVRDFGQAPNGPLYMTLDFSPGRPLSDVIRAEGRLPEARAAAIARQIALALVAAHDHAIVHRDLKPDNVLLEAEDHVRVVDFGLAMLKDETAPPHPDDAGTVIGTPHYMSPEQVVDEPVDGRADLYALGCVLYEMLVGAPPFEGETAQSVMRLHLVETPVAPSQRGARVSPRLETLLMRLVAKEAPERPATAAAVVEALDGVLAHPGPSRALRVLVADDSPVNRRILVGLLARWGHAAAEAADGIEAVNFAIGAAGGAGRQPFDAILLDGEMPGLDGHEAAARIRAAEVALARRTPLIGLSAGSSATDRERALASGIDVVLGKPVRPDDLEDALARLTRAATPAQADERDLFDRRVALARFDGDEALLRDTLGLFLDEAPRLVGELRAARESGDAVRLARAAHELKGVAANCACEAVSRAADRVESAARSRGVPAALADLEELLRSLAGAGPLLARAAGR